MGATMIYVDGFSNWKDVQEQFQMNEPEPDEVIEALYDLSEPYSGSARVVYRNGDKFYIVEGGHCSCYGLEGQWDVEEYDETTIKGALEKWHYPRVSQTLIDRFNLNINERD
jgi:hypothetical protein